MAYDPWASCSLKRVWAPGLDGRGVECDSPEPVGPGVNADTAGTGPPTHVDHPEEGT